MCAMAKIRATGHIVSVKDGEDAVWYEIMPVTFAVSLDADGNWVKGTDVITRNGEECARVFCTIVKHVGSTTEAPSDNMVVLCGNELQDVATASAYIYIRKTDTAAVVSLHTLNQGNPPTYAGGLLARITITVNRAGADGEGVTIVSKSVKYAISSLGTSTMYISASDWKTTVQAVTNDKPYLWTWVHVAYSDGNSTDAYSVATRGNRGALFRQHAGFVDGNYSYQSGSATEEFIDVVKVKNTWYRCIQSYNSGDTPAANDVTNPKYWSSAGMSNMDFVATQLLLAEDATINMLGTNEINLYDGDDNMFGSFRVPHNEAGVEGGVDGNQYALWLGGKSAIDAPFCVTKDGAISATSGNIGAFNIVSVNSGGYKYYNLSASTPGTAILPPTAVSLSPEGIDVETRQASNLGGSIEIGRSGSKYGDEFEWSNGLVNVSGNFSGSNYANEQVAYRAYMDGSKYNTVTGFKADVSGGANNYAFRATNGDLRLDSGQVYGFRPYIRVATANATLNDMDSVIICNNTGGEITLTFPSSPKKGQVYVIIQLARKVFIKGNGKTFRGRLSGSETNSDTIGQISFFFFDGTYWDTSYAN